MENIRPNMDEGQEFEGPLQRLSLERMLAFSGGPIATPDWPAKNLHTDFEKAKDAGLSAPIASGLQYEGHLLRLLLNLFGDAWPQRGKMRIKYPRPVMAGDVVQAKVRVKSKVECNAVVTFELDVWCEKQDKEKVLVGTASCSMPLKSALAG
jgi:acyl dehydratase